MTTEELKFEMYEQLAAIRKARKHPIMLRNFEDDLEEYLEALRKEHAELVSSLQHSVQVYQDAYEQQKTLTRNACVYDRERHDELYQLRNDVQQVRNERDETYEKLQEGTAKLAQGTESIKALHRVIKTQQAAQDRSQRGMDEAIVLCKRYKAEQRDQARDLHNQIMQAEAISGARGQRLESQKKLIDSQRKEIEALFLERESARKQLENRSFWCFWRSKKNKAKALP